MIISPPCDDDIHLDIGKSVGGVVGQVGRVRDQILATVPHDTPILQPVDRQYGHHSLQY